MLRILVLLITIVFTTISLLPAQSETTFIIKKSGNEVPISNLDSIFGICLVAESETGIFRD